MQEENKHPVMSENQEPYFFKPVPLVERLGIHPILFAFISLGIIFVLYQIIGGVLSLLLFGMKPTQENLTGYRLITGIGQIVFIFIPTMFLVRAATFEPKIFLRLSKPSIKPVLVSVIAVISLEQVLQVFLAFQEKIPFPREVRQLMEQFKEMFDELYKYLLSSSTTLELIFVVIIIAVIPSLTEELLFRGLIQRSFERTTNPMRAAVVTGIIFGAYHFNPFSFIPLIAIGIFLGILTARTGSIWTSVIAHFVNNFLACLAVYFHLDDDYVGFGEAGSMSNGMLLFVFWFFGLIFIISVLYLFKITAAKSTPAKPATTSPSDNSRSIDE